MSDLCGMHRANLFEKLKKYNRGKKKKIIWLQIELIKTEQKDVCGNDRLQTQVHIDENPTMSYKAYTTSIFHTNLIKKSFTQRL